MYIHTIRALKSQSDLATRDLKVHVFFSKFDFHMSRKENMSFTDTGNKNTKF